MNVMLSLSFLVQGLVGGVLTLVILAARAAIEGRSGVTFADLWTALAVGIAVGVVPVVISRIVVWRMSRGYRAGSEGGWSTSSMHTFQMRGGRPDEPSAPGTGGMDRFDKFTDRARKVLTNGRTGDAAGGRRRRDGTAAHVLENMNVELSKVRTAVEFIIGRGDGPMVVVGLHGRAKRVSELA